MPAPNPPNVEPDSGDVHCGKRAHIGCPRGRSPGVAMDIPFRMFRMLESTLGYRDPASADWRICPTSFEPRRRAGVGRPGPVRLRCHGPASFAWLVSRRPGALPEAFSPDYGRPRLGDMNCYGRLIWPPLGPLRLSAPDGAIRSTRSCPLKPNSRRPL